MMLSFILLVLLPIFESFREFTSKYLLSKDKYDALMAYFLMRLYSLPFLIGAVLVFPGQHIASIALFGLALTISTLLNTVAGWIHMYALKKGELSVVPMIISGNIILTMLFSRILLGESYSTSRIIGIILATLGIVMVSYHHHVKYKELKIIILSFFVAVLYSISSVFDKLGVISSTPIIYSVSITLTLSVIYYALLRFYNKTNNDFYNKLRNVHAVLLGLITAIVIILQTYSLKFVNVAYAILAKRMSLFILLLFGWKVFHESHLLIKFTSLLFFLTGIGFIILNPF